MTLYRIEIALGIIGFETEAEDDDDAFEIAKEAAIEEGIPYDILEESIITVEKIDAKV